MLQAPPGRWLGTILVKFQLHTLQLLPAAGTPQLVPGRLWRCLEGLDGRLRVRHEGRIINAQEAPPSPAFLRKGHGDLGHSSCLRPPGSTTWTSAAAMTLKSLALKGSG